MDVRRTRSRSDRIRQRATYQQSGIGMGITAAMFVIFVVGLAIYT